MSDDDKLATAWRDVSREEPPATIDATLRAAARRAVHARPERSRHMQTWPFAAAAVVAVLAIGILQLTPPDVVTPNAIVADSAMRQAPDQKTEAAAPAAPASSRPSLASATSSSPAETTTPAPTPADKSAHVAPSAPMRDRADVPSQVAQAPSAPPAPARDRLAAKPEAASAADSAKARARAEAAQPAERPAQPDANQTEQPDTQQLKRPDAQQSTQSRLAAESDARSLPAAPAPRAEPFPATAASAAAAGSTAAREQKEPVAAAPAPPPAPPAQSAGAAADTQPKRQIAAANAMQADESRPRGPASAGLMSAAPERAKDAAIKPPDEWIKLIRRLKSEGRNDEAAKELAAFRTAYGERADALLPADLRAARP
jgi:hypothetical protein